MAERQPRKRELKVSVSDEFRRAVGPALRRYGARLGLTAALAGILLLGVNEALQTASAEGDTRTLSFRHLHTQETITVTFKRNGRYDDAALKQLNWFMRDWRRNEQTTMDPKLFDILWEVTREVGARDPIEVICGYRAPGTNEMLRARSSGVAENSNHVNGQAMDFEIPGVPLARIREVGLRLQRGGVGFYPTSGSPFVHLDTGSIRHWPRMTREQLVKVFPDERTVHIPSDGHPLAGYALALADVERRGNAPSAVIMAQARDAGINEARAEAQPDVPAGKSRNLLAALFTRPAQADEAPQDADTKPAKQPVIIGPKPVATASIVPMPSARPKLIQVASADPAPRAASNVIAARGNTLWTSAVESGDLAPSVAQSAFTFADTMSTATLPDGLGGQALGYAAQPVPMPASRPARTAAIAANIPALPTAPLLPNAPPMPQQAAASQPVPLDIAGGAQSGDSPWLRAAMLTPSLTDFMSTSSMGARDLRPLAHLIHKPSQSLVMSFSAEPGLGLVADRFTGRAVTFLATATFGTQMTASLR